MQLPPHKQPGHAAPIRREAFPHKQDGMAGHAVVAVLGGNTVVCRALELLLRGAGYQVRLLGQPGEGELGALLEGANLLLLAPTLDAASSRAIMAELRGVADRAELPVLTLDTAPIPNTEEPGGARRVPWPCRTADLVREIEAALPHPRLT
jgi:hypothetical protein